MTDTIKTGKATPLANEEHDADVKSEIAAINPKVSTKTNKEMLSELETFAPLRISESGKSVYSEEHRTRILQQLKELLLEGHNLTMTKKALSVYHNINTGTLDKWRKQEDDFNTPLGNQDLTERDEGLKLIEKNLDGIEADLKKIMSQVKKTRKLIHQNGSL